MKKSMVVVVAFLLAVVVVWAARSSSLASPAASDDRGSADVTADASTDTPSDAGSSDGPSSSPSDAPSTQDPSAEPTDDSSGTGGSSSDPDGSGDAAEAEAADFAEEALDAFLDEESDVMAEEAPDPGTVSTMTTEFDTVAAGAALEEMESLRAELDVNGWTRTGDVRVGEVTVVSTDLDADPPVVVAEACFDSTDVRILDVDGEPIGTPDPDTQRSLMRVTFHEIDGDWKVVDRTFAEEPEC